MSQYPPSTDSGATLCIGGTWQQSDDGETFAAENPATGETIVDISAGTRADTRRAVDVASETAGDWAGKTVFERAEIVRSIADEIRATSDELAELLTRDQGKPLAEATVEIEICAKEFEHAAEAVTHDRTDVIASEDPDKRVYTVREPHGVVGTITPWNYPANIPAEYIAPGLAVGNTLVWVPAPTTSAIAVKLAEVIGQSDLPDGALNLVTGEGPIVGNELVSYDGTDAIGFTGSPETGEAIATAAGAKPTLLEMGGNGPVVVLDDADVEAAIDCITAGSFGNAGQICAASERVLVHEDVYDRVVEGVVEKAREVTLGDPLAEDTDMGPLNNDDVATKMDRHVSDAAEMGATVHIGGQRANGFPTDRYYKPTVLGGVTTEMVVNSEESFGPIAPFIEFSEYEEAIRIANGIDLGLAASVFTSNIDLAEEFTDRLQMGVVNVNAASSHWEIHTPFGGYSGKQSGTGRVGGHAVVEELSQIKTVFVDRGNAESPL